MKKLPKWVMGICLLGTANIIIIAGAIVGQFVPALLAVGTIGIFGGLVWIGFKD